MKQEVNPYTDAYLIDYQDGDVSLERRPYKQTPSSELITHTVLEGETIQSIAFQYYGDSGYWGIIADINNVYFPFDDVTAGKELIIPTNG